jgi:hypothetical protein
MFMYPYLLPVAYRVKVLQCVARTHLGKRERDRLFLMVCSHGCNVYTPRSGRRLKKFEKRR